MQTYQGDKLIDTQTAEMSVLSEQLKKLMLEKAATHGVIGLMPTRDEIVTINGLSYKVLSMSAKQKTLHLKLLEPE